MEIDQLQKNMKNEFLIINWVEEESINNYEITVQNSQLEDISKLDLQIISDIGENPEQIQKFFDQLQKKKRNQLICIFQILPTNSFIVSEINYILSMTSIQKYKASDAEQYFFGVQGLLSKSKQILRPFQNMQESGWYFQYNQELQMKFDPNCGFNQLYDMLDKEQYDLIISKLDQWKKQGISSQNLEWISGWALEQTDPQQSLLIRRKRIQSCKTRTNVLEYMRVIPSESREFLSFCFAYQKKCSIYSSQKRNNLIDYIETIYSYSGNQSPAWTELIIQCMRDHNLRQFELRILVQAYGKVLMKHGHFSAIIQAGEIVLRSSSTPEIGIKIMMAEAFRMGEKMTYAKILFCDCMSLDQTELLVRSMAGTLGFCTPSYSNEALRLIEMMETRRISSVTTLEIISIKRWSINKRILQYFEQKLDLWINKLMNDAQYCEGEQIVKELEKLVVTFQRCLDLNQAKKLREWALRSFSQELRHMSANWDEWTQKGKSSEDIHQMVVYISAVEKQILPQELLNIKHLLWDLMI